MVSTDLVYQRYEICSWILLTLIKSLLLNSALTKTRIPALAFNCPYAHSVSKEVRSTLTTCGCHLHLRNPLRVEESGAIIYIRLLRNPRHNNFADKSLRYTYLYAESAENL